MTQQDYKRGSSYLLLHLMGNYPTLFKKGPYVFDIFKMVHTTLPERHDMIILATLSLNYYFWLVHRNRNFFIIINDKV